MKYSAYLCLGQFSLSPHFQYPWKLFHIYHQAQYTSNDLQLGDFRLICSKNIPTQALWNSAGG